MPVSFDIWKMLAGISIFLLGMHFMETGLQHLAGRPFKLFLRKQTSNKLKAIGGGALVTGLLQSSSMVNLMVLAFVGSGVIQMQNALAVMLGANLGTTLSSWLIATVGFQINIESFAFPIAGLFGITMMLTSIESRWHQWSKFFLGLGFLFLGLNFIKTGIEAAVTGVDLSSLNGYPKIIFLLIGLLITSLIQSSSATVAIVLSALHANAIGLLAATAIVLGSEIGTTLKLILASVKGIAAKKRVALGNLLFNISTVVIIFIFLIPINKFITEIIGINNNLLALVLFQTFVNIAGIILFYPFLNVFGKFLEKRFLGSVKETLFIHKVKAADTEMALIALDHETQNIIYHVIYFSHDAFDNRVKSSVSFLKDFALKPLKEKYEYIKLLHGQIQNYSVQLQNLISDKQTLHRLNHLIASGRNSMYAAKSLKDAFQDIEQLKKSSNDEKYNFYQQTRNRIKDFNQQIEELLVSGNPEKVFNELNGIYKGVQEGYMQTLKTLYQESTVIKLNDSELSTLINFNREVYTSQKSIVFALKEFMLPEKESAYFDDLPGFIR